MSSKNYELKYIKLNAKYRKIVASTLNSINKLTIQNL